MTTLVATRQALKPLSMGNQPERRTSKRLAGTLDHARALRFPGRGILTGRDLAADDYEQDDDFTFFRKSKRPKTTDEQPETARKAGRGRTVKGRVVKGLVAIPQQEEDEGEGENEVEQVRPPPAKSTARKSSRQKQQHVDEESAPPPPAAKTKATGRGTRKTARPLPPEEEEEEPEPEVVPTNGASKGRGAAARKPARLPASDEDEVEVVPTNGASRTKGGKKAGSSRTAKVAAQSPPRPEPAVAKIALPMSDTPIINRNKEMRKKGTGNRRSSLGSRGRRASSLIESGQAAIPHREVNPAEFYKHIEAEGLTEPRRMKQLLTWCGERALSEKPPHGSKNASIIHGGEFSGTCCLTHGEVCACANATQLERFKTSFLRTSGPDQSSRTGSVETMHRKRLLFSSRTRGIWNSTRR